MAVLTWFSPHRWWWGLGIGVGILLCLAAAAAGVWFFVLRSPGTQVNLRQALRFYRAEQSAPTANSSGDIPPAGVYRYRTAGAEQIESRRHQPWFPRPPVR